MSKFPRSASNAGLMNEVAPRVQDLSLYRNPQGFRGRSAFTVQLWWIVQATLFAWSPRFMYAWRRWLCVLFGAKIGQEVLIRSRARVTFPWKLVIGDHCWIGDDVKIYNLADVIIGSHVAISEDCRLISGSHNFRQKEFPIFAQKIKIEDECWLCNGVFIHQGVTLGRGSVVSACSIVRRSTEPYSINVGSPARKVGNRALDI